MEKLHVFAIAETTDRGVQLKHIQHNPIREQHDENIGMLPELEIESEVPDDHHFRFPIINLSCATMKEVIKSDYKEEDFENGVTRSMVYNHDDLISKTGFLCHLDTVKDDHVETMEEKRSEDGKVKERDLVVVRKDLQKEKVSKTTTQSEQVKNSDDNENTTTAYAVDRKPTQQAYGKDIKATSKPTHRNTGKQVIHSKPTHSQIRAVRKETDKIVKTEKIRYKTRKTQPLVAKDTVKYHTQIVGKTEMDLYNEETLAIEKIVEQEKDDENKAQDEALSLVRTDVKGLTQEIATTEIDVDGEREMEGKKEVEIVALKDSVANNVETGEVEPMKEMEVVKGYRQKEFGFHLYGRKNFEGHYISRIEVDSGAEKAGLRVGDRIIMIGGRSSDELKHNEMVDVIKNSTGTLNIIVRNEIHMLRRAKVSLPTSTEHRMLSGKNEGKLDFSNMENARPKRKQAPKSQNWTEKKRMFKNL